ncbi:ABC-type branched-subunit amino acid transport system ATPase component [Bradyrhizobium sp. GM22.5]
MMDAHTAMLSLRGLTRRFGGLTAVDAIDLDLAKGELISIIGPNGAGKTTLFNLVTGLDLPDAGTVRFEGQDITGFSPERLAAAGIARTFQLGRVFGNLSVMDNVLIGAHTRLRAVKPAVPVIGPLLELGLALLRPASVKAEEERPCARR